MFLCGKSILIFLFSVPCGQIANPPLHNLFFFQLWFMYMIALPECMFMCRVHAVPVETRRKCLILWKLVLEIFVNHYVGAENGGQVFWESSQ